MIDHVGFEVSDLARATHFYDAVFHALGARRMHASEHAVAYGINGPLVWFVVRGRPPCPGYGHLALQASGRAAVDAAYAARNTFRPILPKPLIAPLTAMRVPPFPVPVRIRDSVGAGPDPDSAREATSTPWRGCPRFLRSTTRDDLDAQPIGVV